MRNGAAFGEGVYLASKLKVAKNFGSWGVKVWRHSRFAAGASLSGGLSSSGTPTTTTATAQPLFAYQIIALCEFINLPKYCVSSKGGQHKKATSSLSSSFTSSATDKPSLSSSISGSGSSKDSSEYYVVDEDQHLVVRALLLFR